MSTESDRRVRQAEFRFYEELNDFLPEDRQRRSFNHEFTGTPPVQDVIATLGIPQTQIDLILVDDEPVSFSHPLHGGERVAVFPVFERFDISPANRLRPRPLRQSRFVIENRLDKLARLLRLAGLDCLGGDDDLEVIEVARAEKRTILSSDEALLKNAGISHGYWVRATDPPAQFREVVEAFDLRRSLRPLSRCMECNGQLRIADEVEVIDRIPFSVLVAFDDFWQCEQCQQIFWKGSHYTQLAALLD